MPKKQKKISSIKEYITEDQKSILNLEKKYFEEIWNICTSDEFKKDLKEIETYISKNYYLLSKTWNLKNKIKIPAERLLRYHVYTKLKDKIQGIYPSAISGDMGFVMKDAIISLDAKTIDMKGNRGDYKYLQFENNQSSFKNKPLDSCLSTGYKGVLVDTYLPTYDEYKGKKLPVLTYFLSINYIDNGKSFELNRDCTIGTIALKNLPNGELSDLFERDIVSNFKTYTYYKEKEGYKPIEIGKFRSLSKELFYKLTENKVDRNWKKIDGRRKHGYYCAKDDVGWFPVSRKKENETVYFLEAIKCGNTARVENEIIECRFDSDDNLWMGYRNIIVE